MLSYAPELCFHVFFYLLCAFSHLDHVRYGLSGIHTIFNLTVFPIKVLALYQKSPPSSVNIHPLPHTRVRTHTCAHTPYFDIRYDWAQVLLYNLEKVT